MKQLKILLLAGLSILLLSCSSHLNEKQVKKIIANTLVEKNDWFLNKPVIIEKALMLSDNDKVMYKKIEENGYLTFEKLPNDFIYGGCYEVTLSDKINDFVSYIKDVPSLIKVKVAYVKTGSFEIESVKDIYENPSDNTAKATIVWKVVDKTPFYDLLNEDRNVFESELSFFKTTDGNWKVKDVDELKFEIKTKWNLD